MYTEFYTLIKLETITSETQIRLNPSTTSSRCCLDVHPGLCRDLVLRLVFAPRLRPSAVFSRRHLLCCQAPAAACPAPPSLQRALPSPPAPASGSAARLQPLSRAPLAAPPASAAPLPPPAVPFSDAVRLRPPPPASRAPLAAPPVSGPCPERRPPPPRLSRLRPLPSSTPCASGRLHRLPERLWQRRRPPTPVPSAACLRRASPLRPPAAPFSDAVQPEEVTSNSL